MKRWSLFNEWFVFTKSERRGITVILILLFTVGIFRMLVPVLFKPSDARMQKTLEKVAYLKHITDSLNAIQAEKDSLEGVSWQETSYKKNQPKLKAEYAKAFDPNTISVGEMVKMGFPDRMAQNIEKYRSKGGRFFKAADMLRIYGMDSIFYKQLEPFISIQKEESKYADRKPEMKPKTAEIAEIQTPKPKAKLLVDINQADTTLLKELPGIGSTFAKRIVSYRTKLGGFYSVDQVSEVYGLTAETFAKIKPMLQVENTSLRQIDINFAEFRDLIVHPYLEKEEVNRILSRRKKSGSFRSKTQLLNDSILSSKRYERIAPYLKPN